MCNQPCTSPLFIQTCLQIFLCICHVPGIELGIGQQGWVRQTKASVLMNLTNDWQNRASGVLGAVKESREGIETVVWGRGRPFWTGNSAKGSEKLTWAGINEGTDEISSRFGRRAFHTEANVGVLRWGTSLASLRACQKTCHWSVSVLLFDFTCYLSRFHYDQLPWTKLTSENPYGMMEEAQSIVGRIEKKQETR